MSAKFKAVSALDDRVARMSDLRVLVDELSKLIALQQVQIDELTNAASANAHVQQAQVGAISRLGSRMADGLDIGNQEHDADARTEAP